MPLESSPEEMIKLFSPGTAEYKELYNIIHKIKPKPTNPIELALSKKEARTRAVKKYIKKRYSEDKEFRSKILNKQRERNRKRLSTEEGRIKWNEYCKERYRIKIMKQKEGIKNEKN